MTSQTKTKKAKTDAFEDTMNTAVRTAGEFGDHLKANTDAVMESLTIAGQGVEAINAEMSMYAKTSLENGVATAQALAGAKSVQDMVELQADYAKSAMEAYLSGLTTLTAMSTELFKSATKPINDRAQDGIKLVQGIR